MVATSIGIAVGTAMGSVMSALASVGTAIAGIATSIGTSVAGSLGLTVGSAAAATGSLSTITAGTATAIGAASMVGAGLGAASGIVGGIAAYQTGKAQQAVYNYNASIAEQNAALARIQGEDEAAEQRRQTKRLIAQQNNAYGSLGIVSGTGSALDLVSETAYMGELNALTSKYNRDLEAMSYQNEAISLRYQGEVAASQGRASLLTGLVKSGSTLLTMGMNSSGLFGNIPSGLKSGTKVSGGIFGDTITFA